MKNNLLADDGLLEDESEKTAANIKGFLEKKRHLIIVSAINVLSKV